MDTPATDPITPPPGTLFETRQALLPTCEQHGMHSRHTGRRYRIQTTCVGPEPEGGYPVFTLLDGDTLFPVAAMAAHAMMTRTGENGVTPMLLVGVGYGHDGWLDTDARVEDYTPPVADGSASHDARGRRQGGAGRFLRFLREELQPAMAERFSVNPQRQALFGHSFGGLFALYTLFNQPDAFQTYIASSPSLWWHDEYILQERDRFVQAQAGRPLLPVRVHLSIGEYEQKHAPYIAPDSPRAQMLKARGQVDRVRAFTRHLNETLPGLPVSFTEHPRSTHGSSQLYAVLDALRFASGTDTV